LPLLSWVTVLAPTLPIWLRPFGVEPRLAFAIE
jgi:hypothetical protein